MYPLTSETVETLPENIIDLVNELYRYLFEDGALPQIPTEDLYKVIYGLWFAIEINSNMSPRRELPFGLYKSIYEEGDTMFHPAVELALAVCSPIYAFRLKSKMSHRRGRNSSGVSDPWDEIKAMTPAHLKYIISERDTDGYPNHNLYARLSTPTEPLVLGIKKKPDTIFRVDKSTLLSRLKPYSLPLFLIEGGGCALAGGFLHMLSNDNLYLDRDRFRSSDIDLFVFGKEGVREEALQRVLDFYEGYPKSYTRTTVEIYLPEEDFFRKIQIVLSPAIYVENIIGSFDLSHIQLAYDGEKIYSTTKSNFFASYGETILVAPNLRGSRIRKAILDGVDVRSHGRDKYLIDTIEPTAPYILPGDGLVIHNGRMITRVSSPVPYYISEEEFRKRHYFIPFLLSLPYAGLDIEELPPEGKRFSKNVIYVYHPSSEGLNIQDNDLIVRGVRFTIGGTRYFYSQDPEYMAVTQLKADDISDEGTLYLIYDASFRNRVVAYLETDVYGDESSLY
jgi:hypothetical protein